MDTEFATDSTLEFKQRLKLLREIKGLKQYELARHVGVSRSTISGYETKGYQPSHEKLLRMAQTLNVSIDYLVTGGEEDNELQLSHRYSHKQLAMDIAKSCSTLTYDSKLKMLEYVDFLKFLEATEQLDDELNKLQ